MPILKCPAYLFSKNFGSYMEVLNPMCVFFGGGLQIEFTDTVSSLPSSFPLFLPLFLLFASSSTSLFLSIFLSLFAEASSSFLPAAPQCMFLHSNQRLDGFIYVSLFLVPCFIPLVCVSVLCHYHVIFVTMSS